VFEISPLELKIQNKLRWVRETGLDWLRRGNGVGHDGRVNASPLQRGYV